MAKYKFTLDKCRFCDADLSKASPEVKAWKTKTPMGQCPSCGGFLNLVECEGSQELEPEPEPEPCPVCGKTHKEGSAIGEEHKAEAEAEAKAKAEAQASIKEAVDNAELPEAAKARLIERFAEATTDDGVAEAIEAEVEAEAEG